jgi:hypothetical protein
LDADVRVFYSVHKVVPQLQSGIEEPHSDPVERLRMVG